MFPIKYIDNNLVWNKDNEVFAYYELIPYTILSYPQSRNLSCMTVSDSLSHSPVREKFMRCRLQRKAQYEVCRSSQRSWLRGN